MTVSPPEAVVYRLLINRGKGATTDLLNCSDLYQPMDVKIVGNKLLVSDYGNNRVLIWNSWPTSNGQAANTVLGQATCSSKVTSPRSQSSLSLPIGLFWDGTRFAVADNGNHRILIWNSFPTSDGQGADLVLGQANFTTGTANSGGISASSLSGARKLTGNGTNFIVVDYNNHRVLIWNTFPTSNNQAASTVVGQASFTGLSANQGGMPAANTLYGPLSATLINGDLWVTDFANNRVLKYNGIPTSHNASATYVLGKESLNSKDYSPVSRGVSEFTLSRPYSMAFADTGFLIADFSTHRILGFNTLVPTPTTAADFVLGQSDFVSAITNASTTAINQSGFNAPAAVLKIGNKLAVADTGNNRILFYNSMPSSTTTADFVLGQPGFTTNTVNNGGVSATSLNAPRSIATNGSKFAITDLSNHRILIWNSIPSSTNTPADVVVGQPNFTSNTANNGGISASTLNTPLGVALTNDKLIVGDSLNYRVLIWNSIPTSNGAPADVILGFNDFTTASYFNSESTIRPGNVFVKDNRLFVVDRYAMAVKIWDTIPTTNNQLPDRVYGVSHGPLGLAELATTRNELTLGDTYDVTFDGNRMWITEYGQSRMIIVPLPEFSVASALYTNQTVIQLSIHDCSNRSKVMFTEGTLPSANDSSWSHCSTTRAHYSYTMSATQGLKTIHAWFKDEDGNVLPTPHKAALWYDTINDTPPQMSAIGSPISNSALTFTPGTTGQAFTNARYFISESSTPPTGDEVGWVATNPITYTMTDLTNGVRNLYVWSKDPAGNISTSPSIFTTTFDTVPTSAPTGLISGYYVSTYNTLARVTVDSCTDISKILINEGATPLATDAAWTTCSTATHAHSTTLLTLTEGAHTVSIWAKDAAGNVSLTSRDYPLNFDSELAVGQASRSSIQTASSGFVSPIGIHSDGTNFVVTDNLNSRVLIYGGDPTTTAPSYVLGQPNLTTVGYRYGIATNQSNLAAPYSSIIVGNKLIVSDTGQHRVLIWNTIPTTNNQNADVVIGQTNFTNNAANFGGISCATLSSQTGIASDGTRLLIADNANNRVLIYNTIPTVNGAAANVVIGQSSCSTNSGTTTQTGLKAPYDVQIVGSKILIADVTNNRVLIYNSIPTNHGASASHVIGQSLFTTATSGTTDKKFSSPRNLFIDSSNILYVSDVSNHRVMVYNSIPTADDAQASNVLGQTVFTSGVSGVSTTKFNAPRGIYADSQNVWVTDTSNHVIKRFTKPLTTGAAITSIAGTYDSTLNIPNNRSASTPTSQDLAQPLSTIIVGTKLITVDYYNHRVLIWNTLPTTDNQSADVVVGHNDFATTTKNDPAVSTAGRLFFPLHVSSNGSNLVIADSGNHRVLIFNTIPTTNGALANNVLGQSLFGNSSANRATTLAANGLNNPTCSLMSGTKLFVCDSSNHRVLIWNDYTTIMNGQAADMVIGQSDISGAGKNSANRGGSVANNTLNYPTSILVVGTKLLIADASNYRVLIWSTIPTDPATPSDVVIGQSTFATSTNGVSPTAFNGLGHIRYLNNKLFIADQGGNRINIYNSIPTTNGASVDSILGQNSATNYFYNHGGTSAWSLSYPRDIAYDGSSYWITDRYNHRLVKVNLP